MSFKARLARLPAARNAEVRPGAASARAGEAAPTTELEQLKCRLNSALSPLGDADASRVLQSQQSERAAAGRTPHFERMGFVLRDTPSGSVWTRRVHLDRVHEVGRLRVDAALELDPRVIALLALDSKLAEVSFERPLILDTETTGLGGAGSLAFLVGTTSVEARCLVVDQYLLEGPEQEPAMLDCLDAQLARSSVLVSFNGRSFDWPLLCGRYVMNRRPTPRQLPHVDLLHVARRVHGHRLRRCTLKHLETEVLGFERHGDLDGAEVAATYLHYLRGGDAAPLERVVAHNEWDVVSTALLLGLYSKSEALLADSDVIGLARTFKRARALPDAKHAADLAVKATGDPLALKLRGEVHKVLGDRLAALADWELANEQIDDPDLRLRLAKLYEHFCGRPSDALTLLERGTPERASDHERRVARLRRRIQKP